MVCPDKLAAIPAALIAAVLGPPAAAAPEAPAAPAGLRVTVQTGRVRWYAACLAGGAAVLIFVLVWL